MAEKETIAETPLAIANRLLEEGRAPSEGIMAYALVSIANGLDGLLKRMDETACGHGVVTLFSPCIYCQRMEGR